MSANMMQCIALVFFPVVGFQYFLLEVLALIIIIESLSESGIFTWTNFSDINYFFLNCSCYDGADCDEQ